MGKSEKIAELVFRYLRGELTDEQQRELDTWRNASPQNEQIFKEETDVENIRSGLKEMYDSKEEVWQKILEKAPKLASPYVGKRIFPRLWLAAAILLVIISSTWYILTHHSSDQNDLPPNSALVQQDIPPGGPHATLVLANGRIVFLDSARNGLLSEQGVSIIVKQNNSELVYNLNHSLKTDEGKINYNILQTPRGGEFSVLLPDGSKVWLNSASTLRYPTAFAADKRTVELTGEGYFEVAKSHIPFYVMVNQSSQVEVLGTHFNIMAYSDEPFIETTLLEGKVKVSLGSDSQIIKPGEQAKIGDQKMEIVQHVDVDNIVAWKNGRIFFKDTDIPSIMRMISRWYDVDVVYDGTLTSRSITGGISRNAHLSELLQILTLNNVHYKIEGKKITITQ